MHVGYIQRKLEVVEGTADTAYLHKFIELMSRQFLNSCMFQY